MNDYQKGYRDALIDVSNDVQKRKNAASLQYWKSLDDTMHYIRLMLGKELPAETKNQELR